MKIIIASLIMLLSSTAQALTTVDEYKRLWKDDKDAVMLYVNGYGAGVSWMNIYSHNKGLSEKQVYCQPESLSLNAENYIDLLNTRIEEIIKLKGENSLKDIPIELLLISALEQTFPCN